MKGASRVPRRCASAALIALAAATIACGVPEGAVETIPRAQLPESLRMPQTTTSTSELHSTAATLAVYWVSGRGLVPEPVSFGSAPESSRLIDILERGPATSSQELRSAVSGPDVLSGSSVDEATVEVEVGEDFEDLIASEQTLAVAQLVLTVTTVPGVEEVAIRRRGQVVDVLLPDGTLVRRPLRRNDYASMVA